MSQSIHYENGSNDVAVEKFSGNFNSSERLSKGFSSKFKFVRKFSSQFYYFCTILLLIFLLIFLELVFPRHVTVINHINYYTSTNYTTSPLQPTLKSNITSPLPFSSSIYTTTFLPLQYSEEDSTNESLYNCKLFLSDAYQLRIYDLKTNKSSLYHEALQNITSFDIVKSSVFFTEKNISLIQSLNKSHENVTIYSHLTPQAMAVDSLTKKFYILDKSANTINVRDFEGKYFGIVLSGIEELHDIVLDVEGGYMFILQYQKSILRINLDGTNIQEIVKDSKITAIAIDRQRKQVLWATTDSRIFKIDYNGKKQTIITAVSSSKIICSLAKHENRLFWVERSSPNVLWECEYRHEICINHKNLPTLYNNITTIKISDWDVNEDRIYNPCLVDNGNCSHFCLLSPNKRRTCACTTGYQLDSDLQSCKLDTRDFILYSTNLYLRGIAIDTSDRDTFRNVILPNRNENYLTIFDYDVENDKFYFQNNGKVEAMNIKKESKVETVIDDRKTSKIAFDWTSKNLYYIWEGDIWLYRNNFNKQITTSGGISDIVFDLRGGRLNFLIQWFDRYVSYYKYCSSNLDGSGLVEINPNLTYTSRLFFDPDANKTYYKQKSYLNSTDSTKSYKLPIGYTIVDHVPSFYGEYLYMRNISGIYQMNKSNFNGKVTLVIPRFREEIIIQMKVFKRGIDYSDGIVSDCAVNNGGCEHFCFSEPKKYCGCADNYKLSGDDKSCVSS